MSSLFSFAFTAIFLAFVVAAIVGHALLIEALRPPFFRQAGRPASRSGDGQAARC